MDLSPIFNAKGEALLIYRGDCSKRGLNGSALFVEGQRFELPVDDTDVSFVSDTVTVKSLREITEEEFGNHIFGHSVVPVVDSDVGPMEPEDLCTIVKFKQETARPIPNQIWHSPRSH